MKVIMNPYAVIQTGGKQYLVHSEDVFQVERLRADAGSEIELKPVFAFSDGTTLTVGKPYVENAVVKAIVLKHIRGPKVIAFKQKRRKGYRRKIGHRQELTILQIKGINT